MTKIQLTSDEIISLIKEKTIKKDGFAISSNSSFLSILGLLNDEMVQELSYARTTQP